jgi:hypothetical protein
LIKDAQNYYLKGNEPDYNGYKIQTKNIGITSTIKDVKAADISRIKRRNM